MFIPCELELELANSMFTRALFHKTTELYERFPPYITKFGKFTNSREISDRFFSTFSYLSTRIFREPENFTFTFLGNFSENSITWSGLFYACTRFFKKLVQAQKSPLQVMELSEKFPRNVKVKFSGSRKIRVEM